MPTFVLDANVLYSARLRDLWLQLVSGGAVRAHWTDEIENEWTTAVCRTRPELKEQIARTAAIIRTRFTRNYIPADQIPDMTFGLPDPGDEHVVRAALAVGGVIVTANLVDFPKAILRPHGIDVMKPDAALLSIAKTDEGAMLDAARAIRARLRSPEVDAPDFASRFARTGCRGFADWLSQRSSQI